MICSSYQILRSETSPHSESAVDCSLTVGHHIGQILFLHLPNKVDVGKKKMSSHETFSLRPALSQ
jgi:hypothetical protein